MRTLAFLTILGLLGCQDGTDKGADTGGTGDGGAAGDGGASDTGADQGWCAVLDVLDRYACTACHTADGATAPDLVTDPYAALVDQPSAYYSGEVLVVPGDPDASFLVAKVAGTQGADQGDPMPPSGAIDAADVQVVRDWIAAGATSDCSDPGGDTGSATYHPEGWSDPDVHGLAAKMQDETCVDCHGADLTGSGSAVSCDTCHESGWRTDCTWCHGGQDDQTGAPPVHISGVDEGSDATFIPHGAHVQDTDLHVAWDCTTCHVQPDDVLSDGHLFVGDATPGRAETDFSAGLGAGTSWDGAGGCANNYCHGDGQGANGSVDHAESVGACGDCHGDRSSASRLSGRHAQHVSEGLACADCHADTASGSTAIADTALHVDGSVQVAFSTSTMTMSGGTCTGLCHGQGHWSESWSGGGGGDDDR